MTLGSESRAITSMSRFDVLIRVIDLAVQEDKQIDHHSHYREPDTPESPRNEPLSDFHEAPNPENLAGYKDQQQGEHDQIETGGLVETCDQKYNTRKNQ